MLVGWLENTAALGQKPTQVPLCPPQTCTALHVIEPKPPWRQTAQRLTADDLARLTLAHISSDSSTNYLASLGSVKCSSHYKQPRPSEGNAGALRYRGVSMRRTSPSKLQLLVHPSHLRACGRGWFKLRTSARVRPHTCRNNSSLSDINTKLSTRNNAQHWLLTSTCHPVIFAFVRDNCKYLNNPHRHPNSFYACL